MKLGKTLLKKAEVSTMSEKNLIAWNLTMIIIELTF